MGSLSGVNFAKYGPQKVVEEDIGGIFKGQEDKM